MQAMLLVLAMALSAPALKEKANSGDIVGEWTLESSSLGGKAVPVAMPDNLTYQFTADGKWIIKSADGKASASARDFTLNPKADPPTIDVPVPKAGVLATRTMLGIWKVDGDTLTICFTAGDGERPKNFAPADGARTIVMVLKRVKPKE